MLNIYITYISHTGTQYRYNVDGVAIRFSECRVGRCGVGENWAGPEEKPTKDTTSTS